MRTMTVQSPMQPPVGPRRTPAATNAWGQDDHRPHDAYDFTISPRRLWEGGPARVAQGRGEGPGAASQGRDWRSQGTAVEEIYTGADSGYESYAAGRLQHHLQSVPRASRPHPDSPPEASPPPPHASLSRAESGQWYTDPTLTHLPMRRRDRSRHHHHHHDQNTAPHLTGSAQAPDAGSSEEANFHVEVAPQVRRRRRRRGEAAPAAVLDGGCVSVAVDPLSSADGTWVSYGAGQAGGSVVSGRPPLAKSKAEPRSVLTAAPAPAPAAERSSPPAAAAPPMPTIPRGPMGVVQASSSSRPSIATDDDAPALGSVAGGPRATASVFDRLYNTGIIHVARSELLHQQAVQRAERDLDDAELQACTFHPATTTYERAGSAASSSVAASPARCFDRLVDDVKERRARQAERDALRKKKEEERLQADQKMERHAPVRGVTPVVVRSADVVLHDRLYRQGLAKREAQLRREQQPPDPKVHTFSPQLVIPIARSASPGGRGPLVATQSDKDAQAHRLERMVDKARGRQADRYTLMAARDDVVQAVQQCKQRALSQRSCARARMDSLSEAIRRQELLAAALARQEGAVSALASHHVPLSELLRLSL